MFSKYHVIQKYFKTYICQKFFEKENILQKQANESDTIIYDGQMHHVFQFFWLQ